MKKFNQQQSGFTPTPNFPQSMLKSFKQWSKSSWFYILGIGRRRERSSQRENWCRGFSLIETLVSITILLIVIVGPLSISSQSAQSTTYSSEQVTAFFLAQEGVELAQKARDDLMLRQFLDEGDSQYLQNTWSPFFNTSGIYQNCYQPSGCGLEITTTVAGTLDTPKDCSSSDQCRLYFNSSPSNIRSRYTYTSTNNEATPFTRRIFFDREGNDQVKVTSEVTWRSGLVADEQRVSVETYLFNLYEN